jgi:5-methylcytosine-specific restriction endonuclease McrA
MKTCTKCKQVKDESLFGRCKSFPGGLHYWCKDCIREYQRKRNGYTRNGAYPTLQNLAQRLVNTWRCIKDGPVENVTAQDLMEIGDKYKWRCYYCHVYLDHENLTFDHVIPLSRGGAHSKDNIVTACVSCNCSKGNQLLEEWIYKLLPTQN